MEWQGWQAWIRRALVLGCLSVLLPACDSPPPDSHLPSLLRDTAGPPPAPPGQAAPPAPAGTPAPAATPSLARTAAASDPAGVSRPSPTPPLAPTAAAAPADPPDPPAPPEGVSHIQVTLARASALVNRRAVPNILLSFPDCLPHCTLADRPRLMADTTMEDMLVRAMDGATGTIDFMTFTFSRPRILDALISAAERGVRVRGVVDRGQFEATGKACSPLGCTFGPPFDTPEFLARSPRGRFDFAEANNLWPQNVSLTEKLAIVLAGSPGGGGVEIAPGRRLMHDKFALVDGELLLNGSPNWSTTGLAVNLEAMETATLESDPAMIGAFTCLFDAVWSGDPQLIHRALPACQTPDVYFTPMPELKGILPVILAAADRATTSIDIAMHHFTSPEITSALVRAAARGVRVRMMFDDDDCMVRAPDYVRTLARAGAVLRYLPTSCQMNQLQHDKFGIFDGARVIHGPANWTKAGLLTNYENFLVYDNPEYVAAFVTLFDRAFALTLPREACGCDPREPACRERFCLDRR